MLFWYLALLPAAVWGVMWLQHRRVAWFEAAGGTAAALILAGCFHGCSALAVPMDAETWSGEVVDAVHQPPWREYYEEAVYRTEFYDCGTTKEPRTCSRQVFDHWEPHRRWHADRWWVTTTLGTFDVDETRWRDVVRCLGGRTRPVPGHRTTWEHASRLIGGDPDDHWAVRDVPYTYPVTDLRRFENRLLRAPPNLYSFPEVPEERRAGLFEWPGHGDRFDTDRLQGTAREAFSQRAWDQVNARLGPVKKVNLVCLGFGDRSADVVDLQQALWKGGRKNDLVLCFGGPPASPTWARVFGWTERELVKRRLESLVRRGLSDAVLPELEEIVAADYELLRFEEKFAHLLLETPAWMYVVYLVVVAGTQAGLHRWALTNPIDKDGP